jgi:hypothetical protein
MYCFLAVFLLAVTISYKLKTKLIVSIPMVFSWFVIAAYFFAMARNLHLIDYLSCFIIALILILFILEIKKINHRDLRKIILDGGFIGLICGAVLIAFLARSRVPGRWDDLVCWALDTKTIYLNNGFSPNDMPTTFDYSGYKPGVMICLWLFCHLIPHMFYDQLIYMGYYVLFLIIISPVFLVLDFKKYNLIKSVAAGVGLSLLFTLFPSIICNAEYYVISPEFIQSAIFGILLLLIFRTFGDKIPDNVANILFFSYIMLLTLIKDTSILFAVLILLFSFCVKLIEKNKNGIKLFTIFFSAVPLILLSLSWNIFCKYATRYIASTFSFESYFHNMTSYFSGHPVTSDTNDYVSAIKKAVLYYPMNSNEGFGVKLLFPIVFIVILISIFLLYKFKVYEWSRKEVIFIELFVGLSILIYSFLVFGMYAFSFEESQYKEAKYVMMSFARYIEPILLSTLLFIFVSVLARVTNILPVIVSFALVLICSNYQAYYDGIMYGMRLPLRLDSGMTYIRMDMSNSHSELIEQADKIYEKEGVIQITYISKEDDYNLLGNMRYILSPLPFDMKKYSSDSDISVYFRNDKTYIYFENDETASNYGLKSKVLYSKKDLGLK